MLHMKLGLLMLFAKTLFYYPKHQMTVLLIFWG